MTHRMSKKHYEAIGEQIRVAFGEMERYYGLEPVVKEALKDARMRVAQRLADVFAADNSTFERVRFYRDCGIDVSLLRAGTRR